MALYDALVAVHVVLAVVGFGAVAVNGAYGAIGRRGSSEEVERFFRGRGWAGYLLVAAPLFGIVAMAVRPGGNEFDQLWAQLGFLIWVAAGTLFLAVVQPATAAMRESPGPVPARRLMWSAAVCDVLFVVALFVMVTQPR